MNKSGRPSKFKKDMLKDAETLARLGFTEKDFCTYWGVTDRTFYRWKAKNNRELCQAIYRGQVIVNITLTKKLYEKAQEGNVQAIIFWLINRCSDCWKRCK